MINRYNYEEFFLMYVDNELSGEERAAVELFVQQNPDLASELEALQQAVLMPEDDLVFHEKSSLVKSGDAINTSNYEEHFLLYVDNELQQKDRDTVEKFVLQHPELQDAFTLLKQVKLEPETIPFPDKQLLLRRSAARVVPFTWKQMAVAAALVGFAFMVWMAVPGEQPSGNAPVAQQQVTTPDQQQQPGTKTGAELVQSVPQQQAATVQDVETDVPAVADSRKVPVFKANQQTAQQQSTASDKSAVNNREMIAPLTTGNDQEVIAYNNPPEAVDTKTAVMPETAPVVVADETGSRQPADVNSYAETAVYRELDTEDDVNSNTMYVGAIGVNKNKVRGIMKKFGGIFAGKSKDIAGSNPGTIKVAAFELDTK